VTREMAEYPAKKNEENYEFSFQRQFKLGEYPAEQTKK
jgi:hypothetical protein